MTKGSVRAPFSAAGRAPYPLPCVHAPIAALNPAAAPHTLCRAAAVRLLPPVPRERLLAERYADMEEGDGWVGEDDGKAMARVASTGILSFDVCCAS